MLEGLLIAQDNIDEVIRIIRSSYDNAKANLMERFSLSDVQGELTSPRLEIANDCRHIEKCENVISN